MTSRKTVVLVVDDDPSVLRALSRLISGAGYEVRAFDRPSAVLNSELPRTQACLVVDFDLAEMNGVELCQKLETSGCKLPVILITAHADDETRSLACSARPVALLIKPFKRDLLLHHIETALQSAATRK